jgi:hypothetical protein
MGFMGHFLRDLSPPQVELLLMTSAAIQRHQPAILHSLIDEDVAEAAAALASTFETAERGLIYEHRPASLSAERLVAALKLVLTEVATAGGAGFGRDAALVLRRIADAVHQLKGAEPGSLRAFLDLLGRVIRKDDAGDGSPPQAAGEAQRLIVL